MDLLQLVQSGRDALSESDRESHGELHWESHRARITQLTEINLEASGAGVAAGTQVLTRALSEELPGREIVLDHLLEVVDRKLGPNSTAEDRRLVCNALKGAFNICGTLPCTEGGKVEKALLAGLATTEWWIKEDALNAALKHEEVSPAILNSLKGIFRQSLNADHMMSPSPREVQLALFSKKQSDTDPESLTLVQRFVSERFSITDILRSNSYPQVGSLIGCVDPEIVRTELMRILEEEWPKEGLPDFNKAEKMQKTRERAWEHLLGVEIPDEVLPELCRSFIRQPVIEMRYDRCSPGEKAVKVMERYIDQPIVKAAFLERTGRYRSLRESSYSFAPEIKRSHEIGADLKKEDLIAQFVVEAPKVESNYSLYPHHFYEGRPYLPRILSSLYLEEDLRRDFTALLATGNRDALADFVLFLANFGSEGKESVELAFDLLKRAGVELEQVEVSLEDGQQFLESFFAEHEWENQLKLISPSNSELLDLLERGTPVAKENCYADVASRELSGSEVERLVSIVGSDHLTLKNVALHPLLPLVSEFRCVRDLFLGIFQNPPEDKEWYNQLHSPLPRCWEIVEAAVAECYGKPDHPEFKEVVLARYAVERKKWGRGYYLRLGILSPLVPTMIEDIADPKVRGVLRREFSDKVERLATITTANNDDFNNSLVSIAEGLVPYTDEEGVLESQLSLIGKLQLYRGQSPFTLTSRLIGMAQDDSTLADRLLGLPTDLEKPVKNIPSLAAVGILSGSTLSQEDAVRFIRLCGSAKSLVLNKNDSPHRLDISREFSDFGLIDRLISSKDREGNFELQEALFALSSADHDDSSARKFAVTVLAELGRRSLPAEAA